MENENLIKYEKQATDFLGNTHYYNCMGCDFVNGKIKPFNGFIYESDCFFVLQDNEVPIKGFLVINSKRHINSFIDLTNDEKNEFLMILDLAIRSLKDLKLANHVTLVQEERSKHFHFWVFPHTKEQIEICGSGVFHMKEICDYAKTHATNQDKEEIIHEVQEIQEYFNHALQKK